jgi:hypothetical protein
LHEIHTDAAGTQKLRALLVGNSNFAITIKKVKSKKKKKKKKKNPIPVTGRGGLLGCVMLRIPHCLDSQLIDEAKQSIT